MGVALSGGPDSVALLLLAHAARPKHVKAATVDHGLRAESAAEAEFCADLCAQLGVEHTILKVDVAAGNVQAEARASRYAALGQWCEDTAAAALMTAHHADDQAETLLMRLNRGSGLSGLAGVRCSVTIPEHGGNLLRPLLSWRKAELEQIVTDAGITPIRDPSNADDRFDRARIRKALGEADWLDPLAIAQSAAHLSDASDALEWAANREWNERVEVNDEALAYRPTRGIPNELRFRVLSRAITQLGKAPRGEAVAGLLGALDEGRGGNVAGVLAIAKDGVWLLRREPPRGEPPSSSQQ
ncbi:MAG: tRNA lysidine(34) synthetase TilS [Erythrobacter sp.]